MTPYASLALLATLILATLWLLRWSGRASRNWRPDALHDAKLIMVERDLYTRSPYPIAGRPDQVFQLPDGQLVPVEFKTRNHHRVYETDIAELSLQAWLLRQNGRRTANHAYVAISNRDTRRRVAVRVTLWDTDRCEATIARYLALIAGEAVPRPCAPNKCGGCGHRARCH